MTAYKRGTFLEEIRRPNVERVTASSSVRRRAKENASSQNQWMDVELKSHATVIAGGYEGEHGTNRCDKE